MTLSIQYCQVKSRKTQFLVLNISTLLSLINNYQQFRFNWSVWLEIDSGIVSCFGAVKFSSGGQHSSSWLEVSETGETGETGETKHNKMWSWLAELALYLPGIPGIHRFLQKHLLDWVTWQSRARSSPWSKYNFSQGRFSVISPPAPWHNPTWRNVWPVLLCLSVEWLMVSVNISLHP